MDKRRLKAIIPCLRAFQDKDFWKIRRGGLREKILILIVLIPIIVRDLIWGLFSKRN